MTDVVDQELEKLITRRASTDHETTADERSRLWRESLARHKDAIHDENRALWCAYHMAQARRLRANLEALVAEHEERANKLLQEGRTA
jgi:hypothetical protein